MSARPLGTNLHIREYEPQDDEGCKRLEVAASQFQAFRGLVKAAVFHHGAFDAKAKQFGQSLLLVCTDDDQPGAVVAVIAVAVKRAWLQGALRNVGYVFDLRVDESHQVRSPRGDASVFPRALPRSLRQLAHTQHAYTPAVARLLARSAAALRCI